MLTKKGILYAIGKHWMVFVLGWALGILNGFLIGLAIARIFL